VRLAPCAEVVPLVLIYPHHRIEKVKVITSFSCHGSECEQIFGKARPAVADPGVQETRTDPFVGSYPLPDLVDVRTDALRYVCNGVHEGDLHAEERVRCVLYEFCALGIGDNEWGRVPAICRGCDLRGDSSCRPIGGVDLAEVLFGKGVFDANYDPIGVQEVRHSSALLQEFRV
jgi:hypothetical protein